MPRPTLTVVRSPRRVFTCKSFIEVDLASQTIATFGDEQIVLPAGTPVDAQCAKEIDSTDVELASGWASWDCPRCGASNSLELSSDDLG